MAGVDSPPSKKIKLPYNVDDSLKQSLSQAVYFLETSPIASLALLTIKCCDAAFNTSFSDATCYVQECFRDNDTTPPHKVYGFTLVFQHGVDVLKSYLSDETLPTENGARLAIDRLVSCLQTVEANEGKLGSNVKHLSKDKLENNWTVQLVHHLLKELAINQLYVIDDSKIQCDWCPCCSEKLTGSYGDTSIGNENVWHGSMDILMGNSVALRIDEEMDEIPINNTSAVGIKDKNTFNRKRHQAIAESIVFAFLQKKEHPAYDNFLIPTIRISKQDIVIYLYDPDHDVLLESGPIELFQLGSEKLSFTGILALWLALNYQYLCTGITQSMLSSTANFFQMIDNDAQEIYKNCLQFRDCRTSAVDENNVRYRTDCVVKTDEKPLKWSNLPEK